MWENLESDLPISTDPQDVWLRASEKIERLRQTQNTLKEAAFSPKLARWPYLRRNSATQNFQWLYADLGREIERQRTVQLQATWEIACGANVGLA